ncbi:hypothetical protein [Neptuniibacter sp. QD37_11]|uniref:hypothetical protein n=1 Tax=Neptuniibacter sp. QD37_11 TaxID=3398209 RepID=UPI0039F44ADE
MEFNSERIIANNPQLKQLEKVLSELPEQMDGLNAAALKQMLNDKAESLVVPTNSTPLTAFNLSNPDEQVELMVFAETAEAAVGEEILSFHGQYDCYPTQVTALEKGEK